MSTDKEPACSFYEPHHHHLDGAPARGLVCVTEGRATKPCPSQRLVVGEDTMWAADDTGVDYSALLSDDDAASSSAAVGEDQRCPTCDNLWDIHTTCEPLASTLKVGEDQPVCERAFPHHHHKDGAVCGTAETTDHCETHGAVVSCADLGDYDKGYVDGYRDRAEDERATPKVGEDQREMRCGVCNDKMFEGWFCVHDHAPEGWELVRTSDLNALLSEGTFATWNGSVAYGAIVAARAAVVEGRTQP